MKVGTASDLKVVSEALGLKGRSGIEQLAAASGASFRAAYGWWYHNRTPRYPAVEQLKGHLLSLASAQRRHDLIPKINDLYRRAS